MVASEVKFILQKGLRFKLRESHLLKEILLLNDQIEIYLGT